MIDGESWWSHSLEACGLCTTSVQNSPMRRSHDAHSISSSGSDVEMGFSVERKSSSTCTLDVSDTAPDTLVPNLLCIQMERLPSSQPSLVESLHRGEDFSRSMLPYWFSCSTGSHCSNSFAYVAALDDELLVIHTSTRTTLKAVARSEAPQRHRHSFSDTNVPAWDE